MTSSKKTRSRRAQAQVSEPRGRLSFVAVGLISVAVLIGLAVTPARTWWSQRQLLEETRQNIAEAEARIAELKEERERLQTDAEIEKRARADFDLVYPGEESYRIIPGDDSTSE